MVIDLIFKIVFDMPGHQNEGLPHQEKKQSPEKCQGKYDPAKKQHAVAKYVINDSLPVKPGE